MAKLRLSSLICGAVTLALAILVPAANLSPSIVLHSPAQPSDRELALLDQLAELNDQHRGFHLFTQGAAWPAPHQGVRRFHLFPIGSPGDRTVRLLATLPYGSLIADAAAQYSLDGLLLAAMVEAESGFDPLAVSPRGAQGLMQLMPATAAQVGLEQPHDPRANVRAGARYLRDLLRRFDDDLELALAAYNAGPGNVLRYRGVPPFRETSDYVDRVLANYLRLHHELWLDAVDDTLAPREREQRRGGEAAAPPARSGHRGIFAVGALRLGPAA
jgi:hypothetical protein